jgi:hypothetical protein
METISKWKDLTFDSLGQMGKNIAGVIPNIIGAILVLVLGWIITKIVLVILKRILKLTKVDRITELINEKDLFGTTDIKFNVSSVITGFVKWILYLVFLIVASDIMDWKIVSVEIGNLLRYLPKLFSALALLMIGLYIANFLKKAIFGLFESFDLAGSKLVSNLVFYVIAVIIVITALNQAGIDTSVITNNVTIILASFLAAVAIGFGFGSKEVVGDLLRSFYARRNYEVGQKIHLNDVTGTIESIDNITMTLKTTTGKTVLPIKDIAQNKIDIEC